MKPQIVGKNSKSVISTGVEFGSIGAVKPIEGKVDDEEIRKDSDISSSIKSDDRVSNSSTEPFVTGLLPVQCEEVKSLFGDHDEIFSDEPGYSTIEMHDIEPNIKRSIKQQPYRMITI